MISERLRRGRLAKLQAGQLLPFSHVPFGYQVDPQRPRDPAGLQPQPVHAVVVQEMFAWYLEPQGTVCAVTKRLNDAPIATPTGKARWTTSSVRGILRNPVYAGQACAQRGRTVPAQRRPTALGPLGRGQSYAPRPAAEWLPVPVVALVEREVFEQVQEKLTRNQQQARRNNRHYDYLLRALVSCGHCQQSLGGRTNAQNYGYYACRGRTEKLHAARSERCAARYVPAAALDALVWQDLCAVLTDPRLIQTARAESGEWLPQALQARQARVRQGLSQIQRQEERLLAAYLAAVLELAQFERKRAELGRDRQSLQAQQQQLAELARQQLELSRLAEGVEAFCAQVRTGLAQADFAQRRALVELLIDRVIVTDEEVEIRYVIPTSSEGPHRRFCHLRTAYLRQPLRRWS